MKAGFLFVGLDTNTIIQKKKRQKKAHFVDDALKSMGIIYLNVDTLLLFAPRQSKFLATRLDRHTQILFDRLESFSLLVFTVARNTQPSPAGGQWCPAPPYEIGAPHFTFGPPVAAYIRHCILKCSRPFWFLTLFLVFGPPAAKSWRRACRYMACAVAQNVEDTRTFCGKFLYNAIVNTDSQDNSCVV